MTEQPHILVVDDDREIRDLLARYLGRHELRVRGAADGREMRKALDDWSIDLIILDLMLPGEDGLSLCRRLRTESKIPVIMLTAMGEEIDRIVGLEMGADDYMAKPFNPRELLARIKADEELQAIPVVVMTGSASSNDRIESERLNVQAYLTKPVDLDKFLALVKELKSYWREDMIVPGGI